MPILTEAEARERWCPFVRVVAVDGHPALIVHPAGNRVHGHGDWPSNKNPPAARCIASDCMAWWRLHDERDYSEAAAGERTNFPPQGRGFCGLAGRA